MRQHAGDFVNDYGYEIPIHVLAEKIGELCPKGGIFVCPARPPPPQTLVRKAVLVHVCRPAMVRPKNSPQSGQNPPHVTKTLVCAPRVGPVPATAPICSKY